jgi:hypothetical protein
VGPNDNGSYDLGPMQINTIWLPELAQSWGVSESTAYKWVRDDPCTNMGVAAWILRGPYRGNRVAVPGDCAISFPYAPLWQFV